MKGLRSCFVLNPLSLQMLRPLLKPPIACSASRIGAEAFTADRQTLLRPGLYKHCLDLHAGAEPGLAMPKQDSLLGSPCSPGTHRHWYGSRLSCRF